MLTRRTLLTTGAAALAAALLPSCRSTPGTSMTPPHAPRHLLLRSSWQTVNIGDIAHTPGILRLLATYLPNTRLTLWPTSVDRGVDAMLLREFPKLTIAKGSVDAAGEPTTPELKQAFADAEILVHGSGPSVVAAAHLSAWRKATGKPYGVYGVTIGAIDDPLRDLLSSAAFVFCRDTISLDFTKSKGVTTPILDFAPDAAFAFDLRDDATATAYLRAHALDDRRFLCVIPRLRWTPYYKIHRRTPTAEDLRKDAYNAQHQETDHAKLREVIIAWVRQTGLKVLICPEMTYQIPVGKELLYDPLPADVKPQVVWRDTYWRPDEAQSLYARARCLVSFEMHSPILCAAAGTPAFYLRQPTDTSKGQMWRDIGLQDWIFEIDAAQGQQIAQAVLAVHADHPAALAKLARAMSFVHQRQRKTMAVVAKGSVPVLRD